MVIKKKIKVWTVSNDFNDQRIDYWLKKNISFVSYPSICKLLRKGIIRVNGKRVRNNDILKFGDKINFTRTIKEEESSDKKKNIITNLQNLLGNLWFIKMNSK